MRPRRFGQVVLARRALLVPVGSGLKLLRAGHVGAAMFVQLMGRPTGTGLLSCRLPTGMPLRERVRRAQELDRLLRWPELPMFQERQAELEQELVATAERTELPEGCTASLWWGRTDA